MVVDQDGWAYNVWDHQDRKPLPDGYTFDYYGEDGLQHPTESPTGESLTWMTAGELLAVPIAWPPLPTTVAALAYLKVLDPDTPVILYFS